MKTHIIPARNCGKTQKVKEAQTAFEKYWQGSATQSVYDAYASGNFITVKVGEQK